MGRIKDAIFWWLPVRNRLFLNKQEEELGVIKEIGSQLNTEIFGLKETIKDLQESLNKMDQEHGKQIRDALDRMEQEHGKQNQKFHEEIKDSAEKMEQLLTDAKQEINWLKEKNIRLEKILTHYHKQDMQMFWQGYRREGETTEEAQKRFFLSLPTAQGYERDLQVLETMLLKKFAEICEAHQLKYWLAFGTLLGAVRHKGFVPWDDDIDTCMAREDIDKLREILRDDPEYQLTVRYDAWGYCKQIRFWFRNSELPVFLDIFPHDWTTHATKDVWETFQTTRKKLIEELSDESNPVIRELRRVGCVEEESELGQKIKEIFDKHYKRLWNENVLCEKEHAAGCLHSFDSWSYCDHSNTIAKELIYPLEKMEFEGREYSVPHESVYLLQQLYGLDFYSFPCGEPHFIHADWKNKEQLMKAEIKKRMGGS